MKYYNWNLSNKCITVTTTVELGNMAFQVGNDIDNVNKNRDELSSLLTFDRKNIVFVHQTHSDVIKEVTNKDLGKGMNDFTSGVEADALYTKEKGIALGIFHADCAPIFFIDETIPLVGIIHAGHIGTLKHITYKVLNEVINKEHLNPQNIKVFIGPLRRKESYLVDELEEENIIKNGCKEALSNHHFDLYQSNYLDLLKCGVRKENIIDSKIDTYLDKNCFSAYKKTPIGRMASLIYLK